MAPLRPTKEARAWDLCFLLFFLLPLATGGVWLRRPHLRLEITQLGPAVAALALWLWWGRKRGLADRSFFVPWIYRAARGWRDALLRREKATLLLAWLAFGALWFATAWARHHQLRSGAIDLGIFTNAIWNLAQTGHPFAALKSGHSLLTDHQSFIIYPISRIFPLHPGPGILLFLQSFGLAAGGIALYLLGRQRLDRASPILAALPFAYWLYSPTRAANLFDFHPEALMLPLFLFGVWGLQERAWRRRAAGLACFLLAMSAKESGGPVAAGIGLAWLLGAGPAGTAAFTRAFGPVAAALGVGLFYFDTKVMPAIMDLHYVYGDLYAPFGSSLSELALAPFRHPAELARRLLGWSRIHFLFRILLPLGFLPLLAPVALLAALPGVLMLFLAQGDQRLSLGFHYAIEPSVGIFLALVAALALPRWRGKEEKVAWALLALGLFTYGRSEIFHWRYHTLTDHQRWVRDEIVPRIDPVATLGASSALVPHLAIRHWSHYLPILPTEEKRPVDCVLWERSVSNAPMSDAEAVELTAELSAGYDLEYGCRSLTLHRRKGRARPCAAGLPACPAG